MINYFDVKDRMPPERSRAADVILFVWGTIERLIDKGYATGPKMMTEKGWEAFNQLEAEGFAITHEEMEGAVEALKQQGLV